MKWQAKSDSIKTRHYEIKHDPNVGSAIPASQFSPMS